MRLSRHVPALLLTVLASAAGLVVAAPAQAAERTCTEYAYRPGYFDDDIYAGAKVSCSGPPSTVSLTAFLDTAPSPDGPWLEVAHKLAGSFYGYAEARIITDGPCDQWYQIRTEHNPMWHIPDQTYGPWFLACKPVA